MEDLCSDEDEPIQCTRQNILRRIGDPDSDPEEYVDNSDPSNILEDSDSDESVSDINTNVDPFTDMKLLSKIEIQWLRNVVFQEPNLDWEEIMDDNTAVSNPIDYFYKYITEDLFEVFATYTNVNDVQKGTPNFLTTTNLAGMRQKKVLDLLPFSCSSCRKSNKGNNHSLLIRKESPCQVLRMKKTNQWINREKPALNGSIDQFQEFN